MRLRVFYESAWRNSFLDGSNNEPLPKGGRGFIGSMTSLKKEGNFIRQDVTINTVMGVLNRLIGDQRKLYQARAAEAYYFSDIEGKISFVDQVEKRIESKELVYIRNISGSTDQNSFTGSIKSSDPAFESDYSALLWGVLSLDVEQVLDFILTDDYAVTASIALNPLSVIGRLEELNALRTVAVTGQVSMVLEVLKEKYPDVDYKLTAKDEITPIALYTSALYIQLERLKPHYDLSGMVTKSGGLSGISKRGFTKKDFMDRYTTGPKKLIWGNPFLLKEKKKGEGEVVSMLTKASGVLEITLDISLDRAKQLKKMIEDAGVSSFYLGKKGLAYLDYDGIRLEEVAA